MSPRSSMDGLPSAPRSPSPAPSRRTRTNPSTCSNQSPRSTPAHRRTFLMVATHALTVDDIERMGAAGERMELINGELREKEGVSQRHGEIGAEILAPLHA